MYVLLLLGFIYNINAYLKNIQCPAPNWKYHKESNRCFFVKDQENLNYFEAQQYCEEIHFQMVTAKTQDMLNFLVETFRDEGDLWLGLNDVANKNNPPKWPDGSSMNNNDPVWDVGFPSRSKTGDLCAYLSMTKKRLKDRSCFDQKHKVICEAIEVSECQVRQNGPDKCNQDCVDLGYQSSKCKCSDGFLLDKVSDECKDINECSFGNGGCAQSCNNTIGSYDCICLSGTAELGGRACTSAGEVESPVAMGTLTVVITLIFPIMSVGVCLLMTVWRKKKLEEANRKVNGGGQGQEAPANNPQEHPEEEHQSEEQEEGGERHGSHAHHDGEGGEDGEHHHGDDHGDDHGHDHGHDHEEEHN